jgi:DNA primase
MKKKSRLLFKRRRIKSSAIYNQSDINKIMYNIDFIKIISDFIPLKKTRSDYVGRCPFCKTITKNDKHFRVSEKRKRYKCFECGAGGSNAISFLMRYYNAPFDKIIKFVDNKYTNTGIKPERYCPIKQEGCIDDHLPF